MSVISTDCSLTGITYLMENPIGNFLNQISILDKMYNKNSNVPPILTTTKYEGFQLNSY